MPVALLKAAGKLITFLFSKDDLIKIGAVLLLLPVFVLLILFSAPFVVFYHLPAADDDQFGYYQEAINDINKDKNITISFKDVMALDTVLLKQDFSEVDYDHAYDLASTFVGWEWKKYTTTCGSPPKSCTKKKKVYFAKSLDTVLEDYIDNGLLSEEEAEDVRRYANFTFNDTELPGDLKDMPVVTPGTFMMPSIGSVTSEFGSRWGKLHAGIDIAESGLVPIVSTADGKVSRSYLSSTYGEVVFVRHMISGQSYETVYAHMRKREVAAGDSVKKGQLLGYMGSTGDSTGQHLHFELHVGSWTQKKENAVDPLLFLDY